MELEIITPHGNPLFLSLPPTTSISQVMAIVAERYKLDPAHYNLALPAEDPKVWTALDAQLQWWLPPSGRGCGLLWLHDREQAQDPLPVPEEAAWSPGGGLAQQRRHGEGGLLWCLGNKGVWSQGIIQIELPRGEKTLVKASGDTSLPELMQVCLPTPPPPPLPSPSPLPRWCAGRGTWRRRSSSLTSLPRREVWRARLWAS